MKISKRELYLLIGVFTILIGVLYYTFIFTSQSEKLDVAKQNKDNAKIEYEKVMAEISTIENRKGQIKVLTASSINKTLEFYPAIIQEKLILEIDEILEKTGLKGDIVFENDVVEGVEDLTPIIKYYAPSTFTEGVKSTDSNNNSNNNSGNNNSTNTEENKKVTKATCQQMKVTINYKGTYAQLKSFQQELENKNRKIVTSSLSATNVNGDVSGAITFEFYGLPKLDNSEEDYSRWVLNNVYGKELFSKDAASVNFYSSIEEAKKNENQYDFIGMLKSPSSIYPALTFGKANDEFCTTYIYNSSSKDIDLILTITEKDGKYYYKYSSGSAIYPSTSVGNGMEFTPCSDVIKVKVESEIRDGNNDKAITNLKIVNNTNKSVEVEVKSDDATLPRVNLTSEGGVVNKK